MIALSIRGNSDFCRGVGIISSEASPLLVFPKFSMIFVPGFVLTTFLIIGDAREK